VIRPAWSHSEGTRSPAREPMLNQQIQQRSPLLTMFMSAHSCNLPSRRASPVCAVAEYPKFKDVMRTHAAICPAEQNGRSLTYDI
jgi:hypothetical protein